MTENGSLPDNLPEQVKTQHAEAEAIKARMKAEAGNQAQSPEPVAGAAEPTGQATPAQAQGAPTPAAPQPATAPGGTTEPAAAPGPSPAVDVTAENARLQAENADLRRQRDSYAGRYGGEVQALKAQILDLQRDRDRLERANARGIMSPQAQPVQPQPMQPRPAAPSPAVAVAEVPSGGGNGTGKEPGPADPLRHVPADKRERYGDELLGTLHDVARATVEDAQAVVAGSQQATLQTLDGVRAELQQLKGRQFWSRVEALSPGLTALNGDENGAGCDPAWAGFLDEPIRPGSNFTRRMEAEHAVKAGNPHTIAQLHDEFKSRANPEPSTATPQQTASPAVQAQVVPQSVPGGEAMQPDTSGAGGPQVRESEITAYLQDVQQNPKRHTPEAVEKKRAEFDLAYREGRVLRGQ